MADEQVIKTLIVSLETRGDVRPGLEEAERAAEASQRRIEQTGGTRGGTTEGSSTYQFPKGSAPIPEEFAKAMGLIGGRTPASAGTNWMTAGMSKASASSPMTERMRFASHRPEEPTAVHPMAERMGTASANNWMTERMSRASTAFDHEGNFIPFVKAAKGLTDEERARRESTRQLGLFSRNTEDAVRGLDKVGRSLTGTGGLGAVIGAAGPWGGAAAAMAGQIEMGKSLLSMSQSTVALYDPGRAYRLSRAQMDLGASFGRAMTPLHDEQEKGTRDLANWVAAHPQLIATGEKVARKLFFGLPGELIPKDLNWMGKGNEGLSNEMAVHPELGQSVSGPLEYSRGLSQALATQTPQPKKKTEDDLSDAAKALSEAADKLLGVLVSPVAGTIGMLADVGARILK